MATLKKTVINDTGFLQVPVGTTLQRPNTPTAGMIRWNTSEGYLEFYNGEVWINIG